MIEITTRIVGNFAYKDAETPKIGDDVELRCMNDEYSNHIGCFINQQQVGSIVHTLTNGDAKRHCVNNDAIINEVRSKYHKFKVIEEAQINAGYKTFVIKGVFYTPDTTVQNTDQLNMQDWKDSRLSRKQAYEIFGEITSTQGLIKGPIRVTLAGFAHDRFTNKPQWSWMHNGVHKWGPKSGPLNLKLFESGATSGDDVEITPLGSGEWMVKKLD